MCVCQLHRLAGGEVRAPEIATGEVEVDGPIGDVPLADPDAGGLPLADLLLVRRLPDLLRLAAAQGVGKERVLPRAVLPGDVDHEVEGVSVSPEGVMGLIGVVGRVAAVRGFGDVAPPPDTPCVLDIPARLYGVQAAAGDEIDLSPVIDGLVVGRLPKAHDLPATRAIELLGVDALFSSHLSPDIIEPRPVRPKAQRVHKGVAGVLRVVAVGLPAQDGDLFGGLVHVIEPEFEPRT